MRRTEEGGERRGAVARGGPPVTQRGDEQAIVVAPPLADLQPAVKHRLGHALHRALDRGVGGDHAALIDREIPRCGKAFRIGPRAQAIGGLGRHPHFARGGRDQPAFAERVDKRALPRWRPPVAARRGGDGGERDRFEVERGVHRLGYFRGNPTLEGLSCFTLLDGKLSS